MCVYNHGPYEPKIILSILISNNKQDPCCISVFSKLYVILYEESLFTRTKLYFSVIVREWATLFILVLAYIIILRLKNIFLSVMKLLRFQNSLNYHHSWFCKCLQKIDLSYKHGFIKDKSTVTNLVSYSQFPNNFFNKKLQDFVH